MKTITTISSLALLAGFAVYDMGLGGSDGGEEAHAKRDGLNRDLELTGLTRTRVPLSRSEIIDRLPKAVPAVSGVGLNDEQRAPLQIFEKLGELEGEAAVDFLFEKYGKSQLAYLPMIYAMRGWMEEDLEAGLVAFKGLLVNGQVGFALSHLSGELFQWKGQKFHSGLF